MRRGVLAGVFGAVVFLAPAGSTQVNTMPGQTVGSGFNLTPIPKASPPAGRPINLPAESGMMRRYDPNRPYDVFKGTNLDVGQVAAPINGVGDQSVLSKLYGGIKSAIGLGRPAVVTPQSNTSYFPSITRRNRERAETRLWRRD